MTTILRLLACAALFMAAPSPLFAQATPPAPPAAPAIPLAAAPDYSAIRAQSAALSKDDRARAKQLFATAFTLWQSGDFAAAEIAFKQGLDIDPANAQANYYYGDCLARRKDKADAKDYLARAAAFGAGTAEGFEAQAELQQLAVAPTNLADMTPDELAACYLGSWHMAITGGSGQDQGQFTISRTQAGELQIVGKYYINSIQSGTVEGDRIRLISSLFLLPDIIFEGRLLSPTHMEGSSAQFMGGSTWSADKQ